MQVDEGSDQKSDIESHWMAAHAHLKNEFMEDEKYHNLMTWLKWTLWKQFEKGNLTTIYKQVIGTREHFFPLQCKAKHRDSVRNF